jgi:hypothetical protein
MVAADNATMRRVVYRVSVVWPTQRIPFFQHSEHRLATFVERQFAKTLEQNVVISDRMGFESLDNKAVEPREKAAAMWGMTTKSNPMNHTQNVAQ